MPRMETAKDKEREREARATLEQYWDLEVVERDEGAPTDWDIYKNGQLVAVADFKARHNPMGAFADVWLALDKWSALRDRQARLRAKRALFVVQWKDELGWVDLDLVPTTGDRIITGARMDRQHLQIYTDREPMLLCSTLLFRLLKFDKEDAILRSA